MKNNSRSNDAIKELALIISKNLGGYEIELYNIINSWAENNFELYSIKSEMVKEFERPDYKKYIEETCFLKIAHELGKTCGITLNKGHQYRPEWTSNETSPYIEEFETSIYCLRRNPRN